MAVLVIAEHDHKSFKDATLNTVTAAKALSKDVEILVLGNNAKTVAEACAKIEGIKTVHHSDNKMFEHHLAENVAPVIEEIASNYTHILAPATTFGKNIMPRVAAKKDVMQISDIIEVIDEATFKRPIYAGNAIATVKSSDALKILTVRATAFKAASHTGGSAKIASLKTTHKASSKVSFVKQALSKSDRPELTSAKIIVSGGRGVQSKENFDLIEKLADKLGAAVGASRAAVDAGFIPNDSQVGQTGKIVAPNLYIAIGISGAIQHLAGMKDSKVIVAINNDEDAPIFQVADYGLVGDLFDIVPKMIETL